MGLDIYLHKTRNQFEHEINEKNYESIINDENKRASALLARDYSKCILRLAEAKEKKVDSDEYERINRECLETIKTHFSYPEFHLRNIGYDEVWNNNKKRYEETYAVVPLEKWIECSKGIVEQHSAKEVAYFRKVNLLFAYFENNGNLIDNYFATVSKDQCLDIIERCKKVLEDHSLAKELLPTQSGFFFGSTEYDEYYFHDVENVLKQFTENVLPVYDEPAWEDGEVSDDYMNEKMNCYIIFSW